MTTKTWLAYGLFSVFVLVRTLDAAENGNEIVIERGAHHEVRRSITAAIENGVTILRTNCYTAVRNGMHRLENGVWIDATPRLQIVDGNSIRGTGASYTIELGNNLLAEDAVRITTPDGQLLACHPIALMLFDQASGKSVCVSTVQDCFPQVISSNVVVYKNAFNCGDIRLTYSAGSFEQDVVLKQNIDPANFGMDGNCRIEIWTEFSQFPSLKKTQMQISTEREPSKRAQMVEPDVIDEKIDFGSVQLMAGRAFPATGGSGSVFVSKRWMVIDGKSVLVESVAHSQVERFLVALPRLKNDSIIAQNERRIPQIERTIRQHRPEMAALYHPEGFVIDYVLVQGIPEFTFDSYQTYLIDGSANISSNTVINPGAIIKFKKGDPPNDAFQLVCSGEFSYSGQPWYPRVYFTTWDDPTVGQLIHSSVPAGYYTFNGLQLYAINTTNITLQNMEFRHMETGVLAYEGLDKTVTVVGCHFQDCKVAIQGYATTMKVGVCWSEWVDCVEVQHEDLNSVCNVATNYYDPGWGWLTPETTSNWQFCNSGFSNYCNPTNQMVLAWGESGQGQLNVPLGLSDAIAVAGGFDHSIALRNNGTVRVWGSNSHGQTNSPAGLTNAIAIAAGTDHNLALRSDRTVSVWGEWWGDGFHTATIPGSVTNVISIAAGADHDIAAKADGAVVVWGATNESYNAVLDGLSNIVSVAAGWTHNLALRSDGHVFAWGYNWSTYGWGVTNVPASATNVVAIAAGAYHSLALKRDGTIVAWGAGSGGFGNYGQSTVPGGLSNVVAIAAGGYSSMALRSDGTVISWGEVAVPSYVPPNLCVIGAGTAHQLAIRVGFLTPIISSQPQSQTVVAGGTATFTAAGLGLNGVSYQWQYNGANITDATNATLIISNAQVGNEGGFRVIVSNENGTVTSSLATLTILRVPQVVSVSPAILGTKWILANSALSIVATDANTNIFPITYQWKRDGSNISGATNAGIGLTIYSGNPLDPRPAEGDYTITAANLAGSTNVGTWKVRVLLPGMVAAWGANDAGQCDRPVSLTNAVCLAAGESHSVAVKEDQTLVAWGANTHGQTNVPSGATNVVSVAAGSWHNLALTEAGNVIAWGRNQSSQTNVPSGLSNVVSISAGGNQSLALKKNGTVEQWGESFGSVPSGLTNVAAIASGTNFHLALLSNSTVVAWGANGYGQTNVPANLTNVVAVAAGGSHALALKQTGTIVAWGSNTSGETNVPVSVTNAMGIAGGYAHSMALRNDGTVIAWGDNTYGQTNVISGLSEIKAIAAGGNHTLATRFSPLLQYPIDVSKDLLLIYNTNSTDGALVKDYYLAHRPMVSRANVLGIGCTTGETILPAEYTNVFAAQVQGWLAANPTKRPEYVVLFLGIPSRVNTDTNACEYAYDVLPNPIPQRQSVQFQLNAWCSPAWNPLVTSINMNGTNDCKAYIDKLEYFGTNFGPGKVILSAGAGSYGNTNYYFDDTRPGLNTPQPSFGYDAKNGVLSVDSSASVIYTNVPYGGTARDHITSGTNVAGYISFGLHGYNGDTNGDYAINGTIAWHGNSGWWIIESVESYNGQRCDRGHGNLVKWFSATAFGGTNYSNTPVGGVSHVDEPLIAGVSASDIYFGLWASGRTFAICAWQSRRTIFFQAVGDPLLKR